MTYALELMGIAKEINSPPPPVNKDRHRDK